MTFTIPNSGGYPEFEETNTADSYGWLLAQYPGQRTRKKRVKKTREANDCHSPDTGRFCSKGGSFKSDADWHGFLRKHGFSQVRAADGRTWWVPKDKAAKMIRDEGATRVKPSRLPYRGPGR